MKESFFLYPIIVLLALFLTFPLLSKPFLGQHDFNGVLYSQIARNYLKYGLLETKGAQIVNPGLADRDGWSLHTHHPATYPLLLAGVFKIFGLHEIVARSLSLIAAVLGLLLLSKIVNYKWTVLPLLLTPLFLYYSLIPVFEPLLLPLTAAILIAYVAKKPKLLFAASFLAIILDWPGYWAPFWILIFELFSRKRNMPLIKAAALALLLGTAAIFIHQLVVTGFNLKSLLDVALYRVNISYQPYSALEWLTLLAQRIRAFFGLPLVLVTLAGFLLSIVKRENLKLTLLTLAIALSHILVFRNITWYHEYMLYHAIPFVAVSSGYFFTYLKRITKNSVIVPVILIILIFATFLSTYRFYIDLARLNLHGHCLETGNTNFDQCDVFVNFYTDN